MAAMKFLNTIAKGVFSSRSPVFNQRLTHVHAIFGCTLLACQGVYALVAWANMTKVMDAASCVVTRAGLFSADGALQQICESVIVPNLRVRPEDEEMFEMNPTEYIRCDAEGGDSDTR